MAALATAVGGEGRIEYLAGGSLIGLSEKQARD